MWCSIVNVYTVYMYDMHNLEPERCSLTELQCLNFFTLKYWIVYSLS